MFPYWLLFLFFAAGAMLEQDPERRLTESRPFLTIGAVIVALMIGFRYQVSADWYVYTELFAKAARVSAGHLLVRFVDPAYALLNWSVSNVGAPFWLVNLVCGIIFSWGLLRFSRTQANPWLAAATAIPYLVVVVAMGYTRQSVAIGIIMAGLASLIRGSSTVRFAIYVAIAALFHKTAVMALPLAAFAQERNRLTNVITAVAAIVLLYDLLLRDSMGMLYHNYIGLEGTSQGAGIRVTLDVIPAIIYLINRRNFGFPPVESRLWFNFSIASLLFVPALIVSPSSTAVDRMALYLMPLQLAIWSRVHMAYKLGNVGRLLAVGFAAAVLFTWLNFAVHARFWVPYKLYPVFG